VSEARWDHSWDHPAQVAIPCPMHMTRKRGIFAKKAEDVPIAVRMTENDRAIVEEEAKALGMGLSTFMRWCGVQAAKELHRLRTGNKVRIDL
jgi:hypothetical protein